MVAKLFMRGMGGRIGIGFIASEGMTRGGEPV